MINRYTKYGVLQSPQIDPDLFDISMPIPSTNLVQLGRSQALNGGANCPRWYPVYVKAADLP